MTLRNLFIFNTVINVLFGVPLVLAPMILVDMYLVFTSNSGFACDSTGLWLCNSRLGRCPLVGSQRPGIARAAGDIADGGSCQCHCGGGLRLCHTDQCVQQYGLEYCSHQRSLDSLGRLALSQRDGV